MFKLAIDFILTFLETGLSWDRVGCSKVQQCLFFLHDTKGYRYWFNDGGILGKTAGRFLPTWCVAVTGGVKNIL